MRKLKQWMVTIAILAVVTAFMQYQLHDEAPADGQETPAAVPGKQSGNPSGTDALEAQQTDFSLPLTAKGRRAQVIRHLGYTTCWNGSWLEPNWVAYSLTPEKASGEVVRPKRQFEPDPLVHGQTSQHSDYTHSGYDRGHMAPAADMKWSEVAMAESFYLSNICPQLHSLNDGVWKRMENKCHQLAKNTTVYICSGPIMGERPERIGENGVAVPARFFKVACMQRRGRWQAIGFIVPNADCGGSLFDYACSVDEVEKITGHDFFYQLADSIETAVEASWGKPRDWQ